MTDQAPGEATTGRDVTDHPTTQFQPYQPGDTPTEGVPGGSAGADTGAFAPQAEAPDTRSFGGFRTERRFADPVDPWPAAPADAATQQQAWNPAPAPTWVPQPMENPAPVYYGGNTGAGQGPQRAGDSIAPFSDLSTTSLLRQVKPPPTTGWRRLLYVLSGQLINVGESPRTARFNDLVVQVNRPLQGCHRIAVLSLKGGVGKTTITATLGATFASIRGDRVVAVDANPDRGTLSQKVPMETPATVRHLLRDADGIQRYSDVRSYTNQGPSRLEVLASETDPAVSEAFSAEDYARTLQVLERFYSLVLTDCGTGLMHSAMSAVLAKADTMIVVSSGSVDGARSASATLDWLDAHGHEDLVRNSIAVINAVRPRSGKVDMQKVVDHFSRRCRAVRLVPFDPHLEEGAEIDMMRLKRETREALVELAAVVAEAFPGDDRFNQHFV
ncbi:MinD/ParA family protein [[Mycobacterium] kokjensenii]|uniref:MinD/ParA family protein n=1 Tax=[Mycobacterium] kokjensenii TaxID=3064287 RepID=A0ABN9MRJ2_9MYCO|nr:MinD/ParA family protein [Mycolicibacter sp. MU0083]CAJ1493746.1 MinD/ParA family protein [Mycolicibacter sp. MU0083]